MRKTKIVCTLGPSSNDARTIHSLVRHGLDAARFNLSHGTHAEHHHRMAFVRAAAKRANKHVALILDTQGPKLRTGFFEGGRAALRDGQRVAVTTDPVLGTSRRFSIPYARLAGLVHRGSRILLADGAVELRVLDARGSVLNCLVESGGDVTDRKNVSLPDVKLAFPPLSAKDRADVAFAVAQGVDYIAQSFVRSAADVKRLRRLLPTNGPRIIAKIEDAHALPTLDAIIHEADAVMVARGDLGTQVPLEDVPFLQKKIIRACNNAGKPVIVATQMLESMLASPVPTRAEATDVANAVLDGADALMLSGETAFGRFPARATAVLDRIAQRAERELAFREPPAQAHDVGTAIASAACRLAWDVKASAIITPTTSGSTALRVSHFRPLTKIVALAPDERAARRLALAWGVRALVFKNPVATDEMISRVVRLARTQGLVRRGEPVVITAGVPLGTPGSTNLVKIERA